MARSDPPIGANATTSSSSSSAAASSTSLPPHASPHHQADQPPRNHASTRRKIDAVRAGSTDAKPQQHAPDLSGTNCLDPQPPPHPPSRSQPKRRFLSVWTVAAVSAVAAVAVAAALACTAGGPRSCLSLNPTVNRNFVERVVYPFFGSRFGATKADRRDQHVETTDQSCEHPCPASHEEEEEHEMSAHAKRLPEVATSVSAATDEEFSAHLAKPGLRVFDVHAKFAGPCEPMTNIFKRLKLDFGEHVVFVQATSDNITVLEPFRNQSCPAFLFFYNGVLVKLVRGANAPLIERTVREHVDLEKSGQPHPAIAIDEAVRPLAKLLGMSADGDPAPTAAAAAELDTAENAASVPAESTSRGLPSRAASAGRLADPAADDGVEDVDADDDAPAEQTLGIIKPEAMAPSVVEAVLSKLHHNRIKVLAKARVWLTRDGVRELYREHEGKEYFDRLVEYMSSAPVLVLHLSKPNCIQLWRDILGPKDPKTAKLEAPKTLRAQHGADPLMNAFHASDGPVSAARELAIFFQSPAEVPPQDGEGGEQQPTVPMLFTRMDDKDGEAAASGATGLPLKTVAIVKPDVAATTDGDAVEAIVRRVLAAGIAVQKRDAGVVLTGEQARVLAEAQVEDVPDDADEEERRKREERVDEVVVFLTSGPVVTMVLKGEDVVRRWIEMMGPDDPSAAKENFPMSIRALYGTDPIRNAVHGSATLDSALAEIQAFFPYALASRAGSVTHLFETRRASTDALRGSKSVRGSRAALVEKQQQQQPGKVEELQQTLALIKPDAYPGKKDEIVARIKEGGFTIVKEEEVHFSKEKAEEFYKEHKGKGFYEDLTNWMSSAPIYALVLEKPGAIAAWRELAGPTNSEKARETASNSIRALFGTNGSQNAVHGSDSPASALREIGVVFGEGHTVEKQAELQQTLALIKPDAYPGKKEEIVARIKEGGFTIVKEEEVHFSKEKAEEFYKEHKGKGFYEDLTNWMSSAPIYALILEKPGAITGWRELAGPTNSEKARETAPNSIRALFGTDGSQNAVHGSDSQASAVREIGVVFGGAAPAAEAPAEKQQTLALIKPDAHPGKKDEIVARIKEGGFTIVREEEVHFSKEKAEEFYKEHQGKGFYEDLTNWMSSAPIYALILEKAGAIAAWRELAGPTNSEMARETAPNSIRALFGTDGSQNAVHGSDSPASAVREIGVVFGGAAPASEVHAEMQQTLALIKPDAYPAKKEEIVARIKEGGFTIVREQEVHFSKENAEEFYKEHKGKGFYEDLTNWMSSAPIYAIVLEKPGAIAAWRELAGPTNSEKARETSPTSIRALFGTDGSQNAVHGSDSPASALREINVVFPDAAHQPPNPHPPPASRPASRPVSTRASLVASPKRAESTAGKSVRASVVAGLAAQPNEPAGAVGSRTASKAGSKVASKVVSKVGSKAGSKAASKKGSKTVSRSASGDKLDAGGGGGEAEAVPGGDEAPAS